MTIAIGMLCMEGVLLAADSLVTTGTLGGYESKILGYRIDGADVVFALAGNVDLADSAIQLCRDPLIKLATRKNLTIEEVAGTLRKVLTREYNDQIVTHKYEGTVYDYSLLLAIRTEAQKPELFYTYSTALKRSRPSMQAIGAGADMAKYILAPIAQKGIGHEALSDAVGHAVGAIKRTMPGTVGGNNVMLLLGDDGRILYYDRAALERIERWTAMLDSDFYGVRLNFMSSTIGKTTFEMVVDSAASRLKKWKEQFDREQNTFNWGLAPPEVWGAIEDLRTGDKPD